MTILEKKIILIFLLCCASFLFVNSLFLKSPSRQKLPDIEVQALLKQRLININEADISDLESISGIGPSKAKAIIAFRTTQMFSNIEDIMNVKGIGPGIFKKIKDKIVV